MAAHPTGDESPDELTEALGHASTAMVLHCDTDQQRAAWVRDHVDPLLDCLAGTRQLQPA